MPLEAIDGALEKRPCHLPGPKQCIKSIGAARDAYKAFVTCDVAREQATQRAENMKGNLGARKNRAETSIQTNVLRVIRWDGRRIMNASNAANKNK